MAKELIFDTRVITGKALKELTKLQTGIRETKNEQKKLREEFKKTGDQKAFDQGIAKTNVALKAMRSRFREASNAAAGLTKNATRFRDKIAGSLTKSIQKVGVQLGAVFAGRALINGIGNLINIISDFEQANADLAAVLGVTTEETKALSDQQKELGATTVFTATEIAGLQKELAKLGFTQKEITESTEAILDLAAATGEDLSKSAQIAGGTLRAFNLDASEMQRIVDVMALSFCSSALDLEKFSTAMSNVAPVAEAAGLSIEETTGLLSVLVDRNIDASTAGTGLRNILLDLSKTGGTLEEAFDDINSATDSNARAFELFGKRGATVATVLAKNTKQSDLLTISYGKAGGAAQRMADTQLNTLEGRTKLLSSAWEGFVLSLDSGEGVISNVANSLVTAATETLNWLNASEDLSEQIDAQRIEMNLLVGEISRTNIGEEERLRLIGELNKTYPEFNQFLLDEASTNEDIGKALKIVNQQYSDRAFLQKKQSEIEEETNDLVSIGVDIREREEDLFDRLFKQAEKRGLQDQISGKNLKEQVAILKASVTDEERQIDRIAKRTNAINVLAGDLRRLNTLQAEFAEQEEEVTKLTDKRTKAEEKINNEKRETLRINNLLGLQKDIFTQEQVSVIDKTNDAFEDATKLTEAFANAAT